MPALQLRHPRLLALLAAPVVCLAFFTVTPPAVAAPAGVSRLPASLTTAAPAASTLRAVALAPVDVDTLLAEDTIHDQLGMPFRYAVLQPVTLDNRRHGTWNTLADGRAIWRLRLQSPGAETLHLGLDRLDLPAGATLWLRSLDGDTLQGPWTREDRNREGGLWTPVVRGDDAVLELDLPAGLPAAVRRRVLLRVTQVGHGYRGFGSDRSEKQLTCNIDTVCPDADPWRNQVRSTARISFSEDGSSFLCTGTLLNNSAGDFRPYFLTANHCISSAGAANTTVVYWNYQSPSCGQLGGGQLNQTQSGAQLRATFEPSDFTLIELNARPASNRQVYYSGWNATGAVPSGGVGIHHPRGEEKAIAFESSPLRDDGDYWRVNAWDRGTTEQGSSGSCVWDPADGRCVGMLSFGTAGCNTIDSYGKISRGWEGGGSAGSRLRDWLDPRGQGTRVLAGADPAGGGSPCSSGSLCLLGGRYEAKVTWTNQYAPGQGGSGIPLPQTDATGFFAFTDPANVELIVKILDFGGGVIKVFYGQLTDFQFTLTVRETATGRTKTYRNTTGNCGGIDQSFKSQAVAVLPVSAAAGDAPQANCRQDADTLCLLDRRFAVEATWRNPYAPSQSGTARTPSTALSRLSGVFNYGDPNNVELLVKTLDFGDRVLFIWGALSDFEYTIKVRDTNTGELNTYFNPGGTFCGGLDSDAF